MTVIWRVLSVFSILYALAVLSVACTDESQSHTLDDDITPFTNIAPDALGKKAFIITGIRAWLSSIMTVTGTWISTLLKKRRAEFSFQE